MNALSPSARAETEANKKGTDWAAPSDGLYASEKAFAAPISI